MNRDGLLGRPRVGERLLPVAIAALDQLSEPPPKRTVKPASKAERVKVQASTITWKWPVIRPKCGFKASGDGGRGPGQQLARCGGCQRSMYLA